MSPSDKPLVWLHGEIKTPPFSQAARIEAGYLLRLLQKGQALALPHSRPMPVVGSRCHELRVRDANADWRIVPVREEKRRRLEVKGWKVGTTREFLRLSAEEAAYVELKVRLAMGLREWRQRRRLTQADLAKRLQSSQSRIAKMEAGDPSVSLDLLIRSLLTLGASRRELSRIMSARSPLPAA